MAVLGRLAQRTAVVVLASVAGCGGGDSPSTARVERCVDRLVSNADEQSADARRYVRTVYCETFDAEGWVYDDGALRIDVVAALAGDAECETAAAGEEPRTVPCPPDPSLDCALLRHVRRSEVQAYLDRHPNVRCDDETPLEQLGVP